MIDNGQNHAHHDPSTLPNNTVAKTEVSKEDDYSIYDVSEDLNKSMDS